MKRGINMPESDFHSQEDYWRLLLQTKFDLCYFDLHVERCLKYSRLLTIGPAIMTVAATTVWMNWHTVALIKTICPIAIIVAEGVEYLEKLLPFDTRRQELTELSKELSDTFINMESDWVKIKEGELTKSSILSKIQKYKKDIANIKTHYLKNDALPDIQKLCDKADKITNQYFRIGE